ncbi:35231_t:CDS:2 [Racocetra persica]|uniref:35231_t:CDS:1 n=1 Tax=Racocetra persica TaxID=160502 RepID=A0ACA9P706_9GLOM|nr:35231_t:CDS:2 [Racocetra persica]
MALQESQTEEILGSSPYTEVFQVYGEFQSMLYSPSFVIYNNFFNLNEENDLLLPELQYTSVDQSNQIETEDDRSEATTDSDDSGAIIWPIISGVSFLSWMSLEKSLEHYGRENGFKPIKGRRNTDNETGNIIRWCFECEYSGDPKPKHNIDHTQARQTSSKKTQCPWRYNASYRKTEQKIYINKLIEEHNHSLTPHCEEFAPSL